jgi:hypothetical protein
MWYSVSDNSFITFLKDFRRTAESFGKSTRLTPHIATTMCENCSEEKKEKNCVSNGKYCGYKYSNPNVSGPPEGKDILFEDMR